MRRLDFIGSAVGLRSGGGLSLENDFGYGLLADSESVVHLPLLGARGQQTLPCALQISSPEKGGVLRANDGLGGNPIKTNAVADATDFYNSNLALILIERSIPVP